MSAVAFLAHPYQWPIIGWMADLRGLTREDLRRHYRTYYTPNNATIVVVGDFATRQLLPLIERSFGKIPRGPDVPIVTAVEPDQLGERRITVKKKAKLPVIYVGYKVPNLKHPDSAALDVLEGILSSGRSSRLYRSLVYEKQIALYAGGDYRGVANDATLFYLYAGVMPGKDPAAVEKALYAEIDLLKTEVVKDEELQRAKNQIEAAFIMGQDSVFRQAMLLGQYESVASWKLLNGYLDGIRAVNGNAVRRVAKQYLSEDSRTVGILEPLKE
jgi:zinc protease